MMTHITIKQGNICCWLICLLVFTTFCLCHSDEGVFQALTAKSVTVYRFYYIDN